MKANNKVLIYFGTEPWDAPTSFRGMLDNCPNEMLEWLPDYKYRLMFPSTLSEEELSKFHSDFSDIMEFIRLSKDKNRMRTLLMQIPNFRHLRIDTAQLLVACTN